MLEFFLLQSVDISLCLYGRFVAFFIQKCITIGCLLAGRRLIIKTIAIDAFGGDHAPSAVIEGAKMYLQDASSKTDVKIILVGKEALIKQELNKYSTGSQEAFQKIDILNADEIITNEESPTQAIKQKKNASMVMGLQLLKKNEASAFVSAGNTGALLAGATMIVGRLKGIERPALATLIPNTGGFTLVIDSGANIDSKPSYLVQFAKIGSVYMDMLNLGRKAKVGLINVGAEKEKGSSLTKEAYLLLEEEASRGGIHFVGNVEAREIPLGAVDVAVCDGFVGNVILKYSEGFAKGILSMLKEELMSSFLSKAGAFLAKGAFAGLKKRFDYSEIGGAPFLGLNGLVVKAHGSSNGKAFKGALNQCYQFIEKDIVKKTESCLIV